MGRAKKWKGAKSAASRPAKAILRGERSANARPAKSRMLAKIGRAAVVARCASRPTPKTDGTLNTCEFQSLSNDRPEIIEAASLPAKRPCDSHFTVRAVLCFSAMLTYSPETTDWNSAWSSPKSCFTSKQR